MSRRPTGPAPTTCTRMPRAVSQSSAVRCGGIHLVARAAHRRQACSLTTELLPSPGAARRTPSRPRRPPAVPGLHGHGSLPGTRMPSAQRSPSSGRRIPSETGVIFLRPLLRRRARHWAPSWRAARASLARRRPRGASDPRRARLLAPAGQEAEDRGRLPLRAAVPLRPVRARGEGCSRSRARMLRAGGTRLRHRARHTAPRVELQPARLAREPSAVQAPDTDGARDGSWQTEQGLAARPPAEQSAIVSLAARRFQRSLVGGVRAVHAWCRRHR